MMKIQEQSYDDIIHLPHHVSKNHPQMSLLDRAAQFAPFAASTGHDAAVKETARLTEGRIELDENRKSLLDGKLQFLQEMLWKEHTQEKGNLQEGMLDVVLTYFQADAKKDGGAYVTVCGAVKKIDAYEHVIVLHDETRVAIDDLVEIEGELFRLFE